jgi:hypothetical protein
MKDFIGLSFFGNQEGWKYAVRGFVKKKDLRVTCSNLEDIVEYLQS